MQTRVVHELDDPRELKSLYATHDWFDGRDLDVIRRSIAGSDEVVGLREKETDALVASARVITDYVYTGKVLDVIVAGGLRRQGLGATLLTAVTDHPRLMDVEELTVNCRSGIAPFYEACGFHVHEMIANEAGEDYYVMVSE